jgi:Rad3-related DNA helicase
MSHLLDIHPADLGLPRKFSSFRPAQADAIEFLLDSSRQFAAANAPPGVGKSLLGVACAQISGRKAVYLTSTKALQEQIHGDFKTVGMKDIRGRANYSCRVYTTQMGKNVSCAEGREEGCHLKETTGCPYFSAYEQAKCSSLISTNYSYWLHARQSSPTALSVDETEPVELLICDEAHNAIEELARFLAVHLPKDEYADSPMERMTGPDVRIHRPTLARMGGTKVQGSQPTLVRIEEEIRVGRGGQKRRGREICRIGEQ